ncbi:MAG: catalase-related domain-containing protein [Chitinophagaceae bacterium]
MKAINNLPGYWIQMLSLRTTGNAEGEDDHYTQPGVFWREVLIDAEKISLVNNIVGSMKGITGPKRDTIINLQLCRFFCADIELGMAIAEWTRSRPFWSNAKIKIKLISLSIYLLVYGLMVAVLFSRGGFFNCIFDAPALPQLYHYPIL